MMPPRDPTRDFLDRVAQERRTPASTEYRKSAAYGVNDRAAAARADAWAKIKIYWTGVGIIAFVAFYMAGVFSGPSSGPSRSSPITPQDLMSSEVNRCIRNNGMGGWRASMGVSLERFCQATVGLAAIRQDMKDHPDKY